MNELHLFAGGGGGILGGMLLGHTTVCAVEIEPFCRKILLQRQRDGILPRFPIWDDVRTFDGTPWRGEADVVCGGFPCQDISAAGGAGKGIAGERSGLWREMARITSEVRPKYVFVENSPVLTSRGLGVVLGDLSRMGYDATWGVIQAAYVGLPHSRPRLWLVAYPDKNGRNSARGIDKQNGHTRDGQKWATPPLPERWQKWIAGSGQAISALDGGAFTTRGIGELDGVADRVDRLEAIGNGQVPAVAALAWNTLISA